MNEDLAAVCSYKLVSHIQVRRSIVNLSYVTRFPSSLRKSYKRPITSKTVHGSFFPVRLVPCLGPDQRQNLTIYLWSSEFTTPDRPYYTAARWAIFVVEGHVEIGGVS